jgi:hypothetical protein
MQYVVKNEQNELVRLTVVSGQPQLPEGFELIGLESEINPNNIDLALGKLELQTIEAEYQILVQPEILAQAEILAVEAQAEKWTKDGEADVFVDPLDETWTHVPAVEAIAYQSAVAYQAPIYNTVPAVMALRVVLDIAKSSAKTKAEQIQAARAFMVKDVYDQMETVFGTRNDVSAAATASTWEAMQSRSANYIGVASLPDEASVAAYADTQLALADTYAKWRLSRIAQFQTEKSAILNS